MKFKQQQQQQRQQTRNHDFERVLPQIFGLIWILVVSVYIVYACIYILIRHKIIISLTMVMHIYNIIYKYLKNEI